MREANVAVARDKNGAAVERAHPRRAVAPAVDVFENGEELLIVADVPGVSSEGIDLKVDNGTLTLEARRTANKDQSPAHAREYEEVDFAASFRIPAGVEATAIAAETKNGTLLIRLPKAVAAKPRKIEVRSTASS